VATSLAATVAEPYGSSLGGKLALVYFDAQTGIVSVVQGMDAISGSVDVARFIAHRKKEKNSRRSRDSYASEAYGYEVVGVPGLPAALWSAHQKWGRLPWAQTVQPAIEIARTGFTVLPMTRHFFEKAETLLRRGDPEIARIYLPGGQLPVIGSRLKSEDLARSLEIFAREGSDGFYRGAIAGLIVSAANHNGGTLTLEDYAGYQPSLESPLAAEFRGHTLYAPGPPTTGSAYMLSALAVLEGLEFAPGPLRSAGNLALLQEVWETVAVEVLKANGRGALHPDAISSLQERIRRGRSQALIENPRLELLALNEAGAEVASTGSLATMDAEGNLCVMTQSDSAHFGAGVVPPGTGIIMSNANGNFNLEDPIHWNYVAPGKRPSTTIVPTIAVKNGRAVFSISVPGGGSIMSGTLQAIVDHLYFGRSFPDVIGDTRFNLLRPRANGASAAEAPDIEFESSVDLALIEELQARGITASVIGEPFGGINVITRRSDGTMTGIADPRRANAASGF
jgi:gamma-glutamyltranspeptidase/glutathione hydrolase